MHFVHVLVGDGVLDVPQVQLSEYGKAVDQTLQEINENYMHISIPKFVIMPNHIHLLVHIEGNGTEDAVPYKQTITHARFDHQTIYEQEMRNTALAAVLPRACHPQ